MRSYLLNARTSMLKRGVSETVCGISEDTKRRTTGVVTVCVYTCYNNLSVLRAYYDCVCRFLNGGCNGCLHFNTNYVFGLQKSTEMQVHLAYAGFICQVHLLFCYEVINYRVIETRRWINDLIFRYLGSISRWCSLFWMRKGAGSRRNVDEKF